MRDPLGLYKGARDGEIFNMTGVTDPYDVPPNPDVSVHGSDGAANVVWGDLVDRGWVWPDPVTPVYVVSGFPRSGTTMMMQALEAGGMEPAGSPELSDLYELPRRITSHQDFPEGFEGMPIKVTATGLERLAAMPLIKVVFLRRPPEEVAASYRRIGEPHITEDMVRREVTRGLRQAANRRDMEVLELELPTIVADPVGAMRKVKEFGFPIKPEAAAQVVDPARYHPGEGASP